MQISFNSQVMIIHHIPKVLHERQSIVLVKLMSFIGYVFVGQSAVKATFLASAIRKCGGNEEKGNLLYTAYGSSGQVTQ